MSIHTNITVVLRVVSARGWGYEDIGVCS